VISLLLTPLLLSASMSLESPDALLAHAAAEYHAGLDARADSIQARVHFIQAAEAYERVWDSGRRMPEVACNMAQGRLLAGDLGRCICAYRRGLRVAPSDPELRRGLAFAREKVAYPVVGDIEKAARPQVVESPLAHLGISPVWLAIAAIVFWLASWCFLARAWMLRRGGIALIGAGCLVLASCLGGAISWGENLDRQQSAFSAAVVIAPGTDLRLGNSDEYPRRIDGRLPPGVELRVLGERGGWLHVELADGTAGWVPGDRVVLVE
jgi:hypothetical protein